MQQKTKPGLGLFGHGTGPHGATGTAGWTQPSLADNPDIAVDQYNTVEGATGPVGTTLYDD